MVQGRWDYMVELDDVAEAPPVLGRPVVAQGNPADQVLGAQAQE